jgi:hypothetical protein
LHLFGISSGLKVRPMNWNSLSLVGFVLLSLVWIGVVLVGLLSARQRFRNRWLAPDDIPKRYDFALFKEGHSGEVSNFVQRTYKGLHAIVFDYRYKTGQGDEETNVFALLARLEISCPYLIIRPQGVLDRFAGFLDVDKIEFESVSFNHAFNVKGHDKKFAYDICHPSMMQFLLEHWSTTWEMRGNHLLMYRWRLPSFTPDEVFDFLKIARGFVARIPSYLRGGASS